MHDPSRTSDRNAVAWSRIAQQFGGAEALKSVALSQDHRVQNFCCQRSDRVRRFIAEQAAEYLEKNYARVFVLEDPSNLFGIWGYYSLSAALLAKDQITKQDEKTVFGGIPIPLIRIGFMGRDSSPPRLGAALLIDAARRVYRNPDIAAWGLVVDAEAANPKLMKWYESVGFKSVRTGGSASMYAPFKRLLPELNVSQR